MIRRRITPPKTTGYPLPKFMRYVKRFGHVYASFLSPGMQVYTGRAEPIKGPAPKLIEYLSENAVRQDIEIARANGLVEWAKLLEKVLADWPKKPHERGKLSSSAFGVIKDE